MNYERMSAVGVACHDPVIRRLYVLKEDIVAALAASGILRHGLYSGTIAGIMALRKSRGRTGRLLPTIQSTK